MSRRRAFAPRMASSFSGSISGVDTPPSRLPDHAGDALLRYQSAVAAADEDDGGDRWSRLLPEILAEIIQRVEVSEERWPLRRSVVACACVCRKWREITTCLVRSTTPYGRITFPSSLKQPGPMDAPMKCFIKRDMDNSTFYLHLCVADSLMAKGKFLMAARRYRSGAHTEYILSFDSDDLSRHVNANAYMGKLRSDFLGTKFTFYDSQAPHDGAKPSPSSSLSGRRFASKKVSPQVVLASNYKIGSINYQFNLLKSRGPRRMRCDLLPPASDEVAVNSKRDAIALQTPLFLKNKTPRWHEHLQCWCLNFHGRVTVASVKNFQLISAGGDEETVLLQFGKIDDDLFSMDYRYPLSAFQAFVICLTTFGTKIACE